ncbi:hypothetical protein VSS74_01210 [Conexibacter stalactiti]|uniref:Uncharacterized protein n=1 Tax=Conexibacter stalactiti TaxID=1940611 RepID=A0ABU4HHZ6_9ACTN|nr:hypothetical protein [Conexibacter stalactiti]MDW5592937.1 hypothetical protein [Conexibacter stalactiti]MEC5033578.1 hypothetical protein [Conexibacter stalactiti]
METTASYYLTNGRPRRPCPPETRANVDRLAREQGIVNWGRASGPPSDTSGVLTEEDWEEYHAIIEEHFMAEP